MEARTTTAMTFWRPVTRVHRTPPRGQATTARTRPAVTMSAVPTVRRTNPQKIPACIIPGPGSRNILVWRMA